jgi:hypothetical protein
VTITEQELTEMNEIHLLIDSHHEVVIAAFTDKALVEEYAACPGVNDCQECASLAALGLEYPIGKLYTDTVTLDGSGSFHQLKFTTQVHVASNTFGEFPRAFTDKLLAEKAAAYLLPEAKCPCTEDCDPRGGVCPFKQLQIYTVELDNPSLIQHCTEKIARVRDGLASGEAVPCASIDLAHGRGRVTEKSRPTLTPRSLVGVCFFFAFMSGSPSDPAARR